ncbi:MAG: bacteriohopanetetrol glucosamine biosynthesis glycosyltransferase HpnI [Prochloraceae cyanobacterium]
MLYLAWLFLLLSIAAIFYYCYCIYAAVDFFTNKPSINPNFHPSVSILKPLCGLEPDSYHNLSSFVKQDYPEYQIVFAVRENTDPIIPIVEQLQKDFPEKDLSLVIDPRVIGTNLKVSNLANAILKAKYDILIIADSDIVVESDYLKRVVQPLAEEKVGVVTCLYNSRIKGWLAVFEALNISTQFAPSVLTARKLQGISFAFGSTIVIHHQVLAEIGGFEAIADCLADDFQLGNLPSKKGYKVVLSDCIVEHYLGTNNIQDFISRQIRWLRCIRVERFWDYLGLIFTQGTATSLLFLIASFGSKLAWFILGITYFLRLLMAWIIAVIYLQDNIAKKYFLLVPLRDAIGFLLWIYALFGNKIYWRGKQFKLVKGGKLEPIFKK